MSHRQPNFELDSSRRKIKSQSDDSAQNLYASVKNLSLLSWEEECELSKKILSGDIAGKAAKDKLVKHNIRLVYKIAGPFMHSSSHLQSGDLISEGFSGLVRAAELFDWRRGRRFSTYAGWWIRAALMRAIKDKSRDVRVPLSMAVHIGRLRSAKKRLVQELGRDPDLEEIAEVMGKSSEKVREISEASQEEVSLEALGDVIEDPDDATTERLAENDKLAVLKRIMERAYLSDRERDVIQSRFADDEATLDEIGMRYGLTRERIRQVEKQALNKLRKAAERLGYKREDVF